MQNSQTAPSEAGRDILYFDCGSGLAGDMILAALIDLGVPRSVIDDAATQLPIDGYTIRVEREQRQALDVARFHVDLSSKQPARHYADIRRMIESSTLKPAVIELAVSIFHCLAQAEAEVHGTSIDDVHFHEVGAVDSIIDIVGAAAAFDHLDAQVVCAPIPVGHGTVKTQHGSLPLPAPATLNLLRGIPCEGTEVAAELTTPTGAAIIKTVASDFGLFPAMVPEKIGLGAGSRSHPNRPGILRAILGRPSHAHGAIPGGPNCYVIETNIDDTTGELAAHVKEMLMERGALDAWFEPIQMKKGRPALKLAILTRRDDLERLAAVIFSESSSIGMRYYPVGRMEMERSIETVDTRHGPVRIKIARGLGGSANAAPEFEDCKKIALKTGVPLKQIMAEAAGLAGRFIATNSEK